MALTPTLSHLPRRLQDVHKPGDAARSIAHEFDPVDLGLAQVDAPIGGDEFALLIVVLQQNLVVLDRQPEFGAILEPVGAGRITELSTGSSDRR
jgi:hypothetical protein